jgi:hypothetical protein
VQFFIRTLDAFGPLFVVIEVKHARQHGRDRRCKLLNFGQGTFRQEGAVLQRVSYWRRVRIAFAIACSAAIGLSRGEAAQVDIIEAVDDRKESPTSQ